MGAIPFDAVITIGYVPPVPAAGVPLSTPVDVLKFTPFGTAPDSEKVVAGVPVAVTVNEPAVPTSKVRLFALVIAGGWPTEFAMPPRDTDCGLLKASSATVSVPVSGFPAVVGAKAAPSSQVAPIASGVPTAQSLPTLCN